MRQASNSSVESVFQFAHFFEIQIFENKTKKASDIAECEIEE
jgi:hypothetical protein